MDPKFWKDPHVFRPERFLNEKMEIINDERVPIFGFGMFAFNLEGSLYIPCDLFQESEFAQEKHWPATPSLCILRQW